MAEHYLSREIAGTGGRIKESVEDFRVEEIPLYTPCGEGEHLYITVEKRGMTTHQLLKLAARTFDRPEREVGYAGLKDAQATTIQTISVPLIEPAAADKLNGEKIRVLSAIRHRNKLRTGHLLGNRFNIRLLAPEPSSLARAKEVLTLLGEKGVPNYFGRQRYGVLGNSHEVGLAILRGEYERACRLIVGDPERIEHPDWRRAAELYRDGDLEGAIDLLPRHCSYERQLVGRLAKGNAPRKALFSLPRNIVRFYLSASQSALFDRLVDMRLASIGSICNGDIAYKHENGACFRVAEAREEQPRADRFEISATAPLFGHKVMLAEGQAGIIEEALLEKEQLKLDDFKLGRGLDMPGERRPVRVPLGEARVVSDGDDLLFSFVLPKGSYATSLLREIVKESPAG